MSEVNKKEQKRLWQKEYDQRECQKEKRRSASLALGKQKKIVNTMLRLESHTQDELLLIAQLKCNELGVNYDLFETAIKTTLAILGGSRSDQSDLTNVSISEQQANQSTAQESRAL